MQAVVVGLSMGKFAKRTSSLAHLVLAAVVEDNEFTSAHIKKGLFSLVFFFFVLRFFFFFGWLFFAACVVFGSDCLGLSGCAFCDDEAFTRKQNKIEFKNRNLICFAC